MAQLRVPLSWDSGTKCPRKESQGADTRSLKEENFVASIGVYHVLSMLEEFWLFFQCPCLLSIHPESHLSLPHALLSSRETDLCPFSSRVSYFYPL